MYEINKRRLCGHKSIIFVCLYGISHGNKRKITIRKHDMQIR